MILILSLNFIIFYLSCATANNNKIPEWTIDLNKVYPNEQYIAQRGYGTDRQSAQLFALEAISRYFSTHIENEMREVITVTDKKSAGILRDEIFIQSQTNLFAVNYATPWHNKDIEQWETVAYINRSEAWSLYEPKLRLMTDTFKSMYEEAERHDEPFKRLVFYSSANELATKEKLPEKLAFANTLYPPGSVFFDDTRTMLSKIPAKMEGMKSLSILYLDCDRDIDNSIYTTVSAIFSSQGFPVTKKEEQAVYICKIFLDENKQTLSAGVFYYPAISIHISDRNGSIFSYSVSLDRIGASNADVAKRRTYTAISNEIQRSFLSEIRKSLE